MQYDNPEKVTITVGGLPFTSLEGMSFPSGKEGVHMVTYEALFLFCSLIVAIIALVLDTKKK